MGKRSTRGTVYPYKEKQWKKGGKKKRLFQTGFIGERIRKMLYSFNTEKGEEE